MNTISRQRNSLVQINSKLNSKPLRPIRQYEKRREISIQATGLHDIHKLNHQLTLLLLSIRIRTADGLFFIYNRQHCLVAIVAKRTLYQRTAGVAQAHQNVFKPINQNGFKSLLTSFWLAFWVANLTPWSRLFYELFLGCTSHKYHANQN